MLPATVEEGEHLYRERQKQVAKIVHCGLATFFYFS